MIKASPPLIIAIVIISLLVGFIITETPTNNSDYISETKSSSDMGSNKIIAPVVEEESSVEYDGCPEQLKLDRIYVYSYQEINPETVDGYGFYDGVNSAKDGVVLTKMPSIRCNRGSRLGENRNWGYCSAITYNDGKTTDANGFVIKPTTYTINLIFDATTCKSEERTITTAVARDIPLYSCNLLSLKCSK